MSRLLVAAALLVSSGSLVSETDGSFDSGLSALPSRASWDKPGHHEPRPGFLSLKPAAVSLPLP